MQAGYEPEPEREIQEGEGKEHEQMKEYRRVKERNTNRRKNTRG